MIIKCEVCQEDMEVVEHNIYPGTNDKVITVTPCCVSEEYSDKISDRVMELDYIITDVREDIDLHLDYIDDKYQQITSKDLNALVDKLNKVDKLIQEYEK